MKVKTLNTICIALCVLLMILMPTVMLLNGCDRQPESETKQGDHSSILIKVETRFHAGYSIYYDRKTKVMYILSCGSENLGTAEVMLNADGTPRLWKEAAE